MKPITLRHLEKAIVDIYAGKTQHGKATSYEQRNVCGSACCVAGHANQIAGNKLWTASSANQFSDLVVMLSERNQYHHDLAELLDDHHTEIGEFVKLMKREGRWKESYDKKLKEKDHEDERAVFYQKI